MTLVFYIAAALCLVIVQTTILPDSSLFENYFDLLIPVTVFAGFYCPFHQGATLVLFSGIVLDSLSGAPFGLYSSTHLWLYFGARAIRRYLDVRNYVLMPLTIAAGVLLENFLFLGVFFILKTGPVEKGAVIRAIGAQLFWSAVVGTIMILFFLAAQSGIDQWRKQRSMQRNRGESLEGER